MTFYFISLRIYPDWSWVFVAVWMLVPFYLLVQAIQIAHEKIVVAVVLLAALFVVGFGFWVYFNATHVHISTLDLSPIYVPLVQALVATGVWFGVRRSGKNRTTMVVSHDAS